MGMSDLANISTEIDGQLGKMIPKNGWLQCTTNHDNQYFPKQIPDIYIISHNHDKSCLIHH